VKGPGQVPWLLALGGPVFLIGVFAPGLVALALTARAEGGSAAVALLRRVVQVTAYSVALAWLYWRTGGGLLLTMSMHAAFNNMKDIVPSGGARGASSVTLDATLVFRLTIVLCGWSVWYSSSACAASGTWTTP
jgi:hypothetical protein